MKNEDDDWTFFWCLQHFQLVKFLEQKFVFYDQRPSSSKFLAVFLSPETNKKIRWLSNVSVIKNTLAFEKKDKNKLLDIFMTEKCQKSIFFVIKMSVGNNKKSRNKQKKFEKMNHSFHFLIKNQLFSYIKMFIKILKIKFNFKVARNQGNFSFAKIKIQSFPDK